METEYNTVLAELAVEFDKFSQQVSEKLNGVISDTELSTMNGLMATKDINDVMKSIKTHTVAESAEDISKVFELLLDMQENFQFHDIVRQTIERLLEAFLKREKIIQKLIRCFYSIDELRKLLIEMKSINKEYLEIDLQHVGSISKQENKPLFEAF